MQKEFAYLGVIHSEPSWETVKAALKTTLKPGQKVAYEISPKGLRAIQPYLDLINKAKSRTATPAEEEKLRQFFLRLKQNPVTAFNAKLLFHLDLMKCEIIPLGSSTVNTAMAKVDAKLIQAQKKGDKVEIERLLQRKEDVVAVKEYSAFRRKVIRANPDVVIVGAKHHGAFSGLPHKVVLDELPFARALSGKRLDEAMHKRALARSALARKRINRLIPKKSLVQKRRK